MVEAIQNATTEFLRVARYDTTLNFLSETYNIPLLPCVTFSLNQTLYQKQIKDYKHSIAKFQAGYFMTIWRFEMGDVSHHVALTVYPTGIEVFDSMFYSEVPSPYTERILDTTRKVFNPPELKVTGGALEQCLNYTGGDGTETPFCWLRHKKSSLLLSYHPEAQNRFSWGWCLFFLDSKLQKVGIGSIVKGLHPLIVIKRYLYGLAMRRLIVVPEELRESLLHVWDSDTVHKSMTYETRILAYQSGSEPLSYAGSHYSYTVSKVPKVPLVPLPAIRKRQRLSFQR